MAIFQAKPNGTIVTSQPGFPPLTVENLMPGERYEVTVHGRGYDGDKGELSNVAIFVMSKW